MAAFMPIRGGHIAWARLYLDPAFSFAICWNFFYAATMFACADIIAVCGLMEYWVHVNCAVWIVMVLVIVTLLNVFHVKFYGESEFYFASGKVILITGLIFMSFIVMRGGNPKHDRSVFRYWKDPGLMAEYHSTGALGRFLGFWQVFKLAAFAIGGPEGMVMCAAEAVQPHKSRPKAVKSIVFRMAVFFILGALCIGVLVPYNDPVLEEAIATGVGSNASAFVVGMKRVGIKVLPDIFNAMVITSALSCTNGYAYIATRILHSLASRGEAPRLFARTTKRGVPIYAFCVVFGILCLSFMQLSTNGSTIFGWFINPSSVASIINFVSMCFLAIRFRAALKAQGYDAKKFLPWSTRFTVPWCYFSLCFLIIIGVFQGWEVFTTGNWDVQEFLTCYFGIAFVLILFLFWKFKNKTKLIALKDIDFTYRLAEFDALDEYNQEHPPVSTTAWNRFLDKIF